MPKSLKKYYENEKIVYLFMGAIIVIIFWLFSLNIN